MEVRFERTIEKPERMLEEKLLPYASGLLNWALQCTTEVTKSHIRWRYIDQNTHHLMAQFIELHIKYEEKEVFTFRDFRAMFLDFAKWQGVEILQKGARSLAEVFCYYLSHLFHLEVAMTCRTGGWGIKDVKYQVSIAETERLQRFPMLDVFKGYDPFTSHENRVSKSESTSSDHSKLTHQSVLVDYNPPFIEEEVKINIDDDKVNQSKSKYRSD